jgi:carbonic anhydrase
VGGPFDALGARGVVDTAGVDHVDQPGDAPDTRSWRPDGRISVPELLSTADAPRRQDRRMFEDLVAANERYVAGYDLAGLPAKAARQLAVVTCIDSRIEPLAMLGLVPGDAKILRNAGGRVTEDVLRSLVIASNLLSVTRIAVIHHTSCAMITTDAELSARIADRSGLDPEGWRWHAIGDADAALAEDVDAVRACPLIDAEVVGWRYDIDTGRIHRVVA